MDGSGRSRDEDKASTIPRGSFSLCNIKYRESDEKLNPDRKREKLVHKNL